jgi:replicative DNA helicase
MKKLKSYPELEFSKIPPQAIDVEKAVLGQLITTGANKYMSLLTPQMFYTEAHKEIATAIYALHEEKIPIDLLTVVNWLAKKGLIDKVGGPYYVTTLTNNITTAVNFPHHALIVREAYIHREIIRISYEASSKAFDKDDFKEILDETTEALINLYPDIKDETHHNMSSIVKKTMNDILLFDEGIVKTFYKTSSNTLDELVMFNSGITLIAGAGGIGKSTFATWWMQNLLQHNQDISILWVTIDHETGKSVNRKMLGSLTGLNDRQIQSKNYKLSHEDLERITAAQDVLQQFDIEFYERPCSIKDLEVKFHFFCANRPKERFKILLIDNVMRLTDNLTKRDVLAADDFIANTIANIHKTQLADGHNNNVIFLHHMTKEIQSSSNHAEGYRPTIDQIRGSSRHVDIAEVVLLINRPGRYPKLIAEYPGKEDYLNKLFIVEVAKNTTGREGIAYYLSNMDHCKFIEI